MYIHNIYVYIYAYDVSLCALLSDPSAAKIQWLIITKSPCPSLASPPLLQPPVINRSVTLQA